MTVILRKQAVPVTRFGDLFPDPGPDRAAGLRKAHAQVRAYQAMGREVPARLMLAESEYRRWRRRVRLGRAAEVHRAA